MLSFFGGDFFSLDCVKNVYNIFMYINMLSILSRDRSGIVVKKLNNFCGDFTGKTSCFAAVLQL